mmetsp:Transcript_34442/g.55730  ORF Transcript_34442/g.55730 Transcript_34442/m.55730 type:complete len:577 (+) Transcript_34442:356-2086(+)|eukprot:CAMPEP_0184664804 /NCGR_PEP_ID=MMETSP0308-20130426/54442_1 /TAXON_ID=38269 /ORGANISM="Gloeochaete witrockiana, Strain SAG 46.84" /LENGTH=576 /DNA_ID=CAMNT_0027108415 /DNA_START=100 /DNA_END=1830 /DNA_ORIENTATION=-
MNLQKNSRKAAPSGTKSSACKKKCTGADFLFGVDNLPDSVLELIFLHATSVVVSTEVPPVYPHLSGVDESGVDEHDRRKAVILIQQLGGVSRRFRRIVFKGSLWSASVLSSVLQIKQELCTSVLSQLDLSKVNFTESKFWFPLCSMSEYPLQYICSLFDKVGPHIQKLSLVGSEKDLFKSSGIKKVGVILERCQYLSSLETGMLLCLRTHFAVMGSLPLREFRLIVATVEDMALLMSTLSTLWPNLKELTMDMSGRNAFFEVWLPTQLSLDTLVLTGHRWCGAFSSPHTVLHNLDRLLIGRTLVRLDLSDCTGFAEIDVVDDDHLQNIHIGVSEGLKRAVFRNCMRLQSLEISCMDAKELHVENCPKLLSVDIWSSDDDDHLIWTLRNCPLIESISAPACDTNQFEEIIKLQNLKTLKMTSVRTAGLLRLASAPRILHLDVYLSGNFVAEKLSLNFPSLQDLSLRGRFPLYLDLQCPALQHLDISGKSEKVQKIKTLDLSVCHRLKKVSISPHSMNRVSLEWVADLLKRNPRMMDPKGDWGFNRKNLCENLETSYERSCLARGELQAWAPKKKRRK